MFEANVDYTYNQNQNNNSNQYQNNYSYNTLNNSSYNIPSPPNNMETVSDKFFKDNETAIKFANKINIIWRPLIVIIIVFALFLLYIIYPILYTILNSFGIHITLPSMIYDHTNALILGSGILAGLRTWEKIKKATNNH